MNIARTFLAVALSGSLVFLSCPVFAAENPMEQAMTHFESGLQLYQEGSLEAALVEFERAYELAPSYKILYNEGRVHRALNHYAEALKAFDRYLREGGGEIDPARRDEVKREIEMLRGRVASIKVSTSVPEVEIAIDDVSVGSSPLAQGVIVNPGVRRVTANKRGYYPVTKSVRVVGSDAIVVSLDMVSMGISHAAAPTDDAPRNRAIVSWVATGVLAGGAIATGVLAVNANSDLEDVKSRLAADPAELESKAKKLRTMTIVSDSLFAATAIAGGIAIYFTVKAYQKDGAAGVEPKAQAGSVSLRPQSSALSVGMSPTGVRLVGHF
jgi:hypothetical protein